MLSAGFIDSGIFFGMICKMLFPSVKPHFCSLPQSRFACSIVNPASLGDSDQNNLCLTV